MLNLSGAFNFDVEAPHIYYTSIKIEFEPNFNGVKNPAFQLVHWSGP